MEQIKKAVLVLDPELQAKMKFNEQRYAADSFVIYYRDGNVDIIDNFNELSEDERKDEIDSIIAAIKENVDAKNPKEYFSVKKGSPAYNTVMKDAEKKNNGSWSLGKKALTGAAIVGGVALGVAGCNAIKEKDQQSDDVKSNIENENNNSNIVVAPSMDGKDFTFYTENAIDTNQKQLMMDVNHFLSQFNGQEDWMKTTLTEEQMKEYNLKDADCLFGFTASDSYALALRFGHYSNQDYVTLTGGNDIDVVSIMDDANSQSNGVLASIISYYVCSDECDLKIDDLINFNEKEVAKIDEIEGLLKEYKTLAKYEKTEKEAEEKMREIKNWFNEYAYSTDFEQDNAKSYISRTFLPACSIISEMNQYKDTIDLHLYDTKKDTNVVKEVKTALFDEIMMRNLVLGYDEPGTMGAFDAESFLEEHDIDQKRYNLLNTDIATSKADESCSSQSARLEQANEYMARLRSENATAEAAFYAANQAIVVDTTKENVGEQVAVQMDQLNNVQTQYDNLVNGTYSYDLVLNMIDKNLIENNIYPKNVNYFRTAKMSKMQIDYKNTHGVTQGKKGDTIKTEKKQQVVVDENELTEEQKEEARKKAEEQTGIVDGSTPGASDEADQDAIEDAAIRAEMLQGVYNATFNYYNGQAVVIDGFNTSNTFGQTFTEAWATSSDPDIVANYNAGKADGIKFKHDREQDGILIGGEEIIDPGFEDAEISQDPITPTDPTTPTDPDVPSFSPVVDPTDPNVDPDGPKDPSDSDGDGIWDEFEDAELSSPASVVTGNVSATETDANTTEITDGVFEGYTSTPPEGFAPVVDEVSVSTITDEQLYAWLETEEGTNYLNSVTEYVVTKKM